MSRVKHCAALMSRRTRLKSLWKAESSQLVKDCKPSFRTRILPHLYAHAEAAKKAPIFPSASYHLRLGYDFEAKKDSLPGRLFRELYNQSHVNTVLSRRKVAAISL
jgi:hypothetical protein